MVNLYLSHIPAASAGMLIQKPTTEVYQAFIDPNITNHFWFTKSSGKLELGKQIHWEWEFYGVSTEILVKALEPEKRITYQWGLPESPTTVEVLFSSQAFDATMVTVTESGFSGDGDSVIEQAIGSSTGFSLVLANLKAYLEHGINLNLIADRFPDKIIR